MLQTLGKERSSGAQIPSKELPPEGEELYRYAVTVKRENGDVNRQCAILETGPSIFT